MGGRRIGRGLRRGRDVRGERVVYIFVGVHTCSFFQMSGPMGRQRHRNARAVGVTAGEVVWSWMPRDRM